MEGYFRFIVPNDFEQNKKAGFFWKPAFANLTKLNQPVLWVLAQDVEQITVGGGVGESIISRARRAFNGCANDGPG